MGHEGEAGEGHRVGRKKNKVVRPEGGQFDKEQKQCVDQDAQPGKNKATADQAPGQTLAIDVGPSATQDQYSGDETPDHHHDRAGVRGLIRQYQDDQRGGHQHYQACRGHEQAQRPPRRGGGCA